MKLLQDVRIKAWRRTRLGSGGLTRLEYARRGRHILKPHLPARRGRLHLLARVWPAFPIRAIMSHPARPVSDSASRQLINVIRGCWRRAPGSLIRAGARPGLVAFVAVRVHVQPVCKDPTAWTPWTDKVASVWPWHLSSTQTGGGQTSTPRGTSPGPVKQHGRPTCTRKPF